MGLRFSDGCLMPGQQVRRLLDRRALKASKRHLVAVDGLQLRADYLREGVSR